MNKIVVVGRVTRNPELKKFEDSGKVLTKITIAVDRPFKNEKGERETDFIPVVLWGRKAEVICQYLKKGGFISVSGRLQTRNYEDKNGVKKYIAEVVGDDFQLLGTRNREENIV
ncbi:MAG: single-stranded DNA-binding protein [Clostridiaceae bacterium]